MKKKILFAVALILAGYAIHAEVQPRFRELLSEDHGPYAKFRVWHDLETGQEFICVYSGVDQGNSVSCFPTGRNWK
jgi:hypothetical protein